MSTNNAYITEEYLHRRVADVLRDAAKLQENLNGSEVECRALRKRIEVLEKSNAVTSKQAPSSKSLVDKLEAEVTELRRQTSGDQQKLRSCTEQIQKMQHTNSKLLEQGVHFAHQQDELSGIHKREVETLRLKIQQQEAEIEKLRQSLVERNKHLNVGQLTQDDKLHAQVHLLQDEIRELRNAAKTSDQSNKDREAELQHNRSMLGKANEMIKRLQDQKNISQTSPNTTHRRLPGRPRTPENPQASGSNRIVENPDTSSVNIAAYLSPLPAERKKALNAFPPITVVPEDQGAKALFSRNYLTSQLGGSVQSVIANVDVNKPRRLAQYGISCYLCPNMEQNPWCPTRPGIHGYMFVGLGKEADTFNESEIRHVFVSIGRKQYRYLGLYEALRAKEPLTADEWEPLPENFKNKYSKTTVEKTLNNTRSATQTRAAYDLGVLRVPCVQLVCVAFDQELYTSLVNANVGTAIPSSGPEKGKRVKESDDDDDSVSPRRKSVRKSL